MVLLPSWLAAAWVWEAPGAADAASAAGVGRGTAQGTPQEADGLQGRTATAGAAEAECTGRSHPSFAAGRHAKNIKINDKLKLTNNNSLVMKFEIWEHARY